MDDEETWPLARLPDRCARCGSGNGLSWRLGPMSDWFVWCSYCRREATPSVVPPRRTIGDQSAETDPVSRRFAGIELD